MLEGLKTFAFVINYKMPSIYLHRLTLSLDGNMLFSGVYTLVENTRLPLCVRVYVCGVGA